MSEQNPSERETVQMSRDERVSALFANLILQQVNAATMFLGQVPHPETGERLLDLESARLLIDQLEMLEIKTKGNLGKQEAALIQQSLMTLRMAFVEAVEKGPAPPAAKKAAAPSATASEKVPSGSAPDTQAKPAGEASTAPDEDRKKFVKKY